jgi:hypothetical protein
VTITLKPNHGCGASPTVKVSARVPVVGATGKDVAGWSVSTSSDSEGRTIVEWAGGSLPTDQVGAFPVALTAPDAPGTLLVIPFVQECANGEEEAWISGDPNGDNPAPRVLVLPAGSPPAPTIDDVPADAPGRDLLTAVVDVDAGQRVPTTTTSVVTETSDPTADQDAADDDHAGDEDDDDGNPLFAVVVGFAAAATLWAAVVLVRRRRSGAQP